MGILCVSLNWSLLVLPMRGNVYYKRCCLLPCESQQADSSHLLANVKQHDGGIVERERESVVGKERKTERVSEKEREVVLVGSSPCLMAS